MRYQTGTSTATSAPPAGPAETYRTRLDDYTDRRDQAEGLARRISHARILVFFIALAIGVWAERAPGPTTYSLAGVAVAGFILLVGWHRRIRRRAVWFGELAALNAEGLRRLAREWDTLPIRQPTRDLAGHPYAHDLDLFGRASLSQLLGPVSGVGAATIDDWLLERAEPDTVRGRQEAVRELTPLLGLREEIAAHGRRAGSARADRVAAFMQWAERGSEPGRRRTVLWAARLIPVATLALIVLQLSGLLPGSFWLLGILAAILLSHWAGRELITSFQQAEPGEALLRDYPALLAVIEGATFQAPLLRELQGRIVTGASTASLELARLGQLLHLADLRRSGMLHFIVQVTTLWDFHIQDRLHQWRARNGTSVRHWLEAASQIEALAALAALAHDQPEWAFAEFRDGARGEIEAEGLGHPLLPETRRVDNDLGVGPPGTFLLVTGSNMSGKSTLLRAIGTNIVLAQAGAPSCAARLAIPPIELWSSIRIDDSLAQGVSYFMAELKRLKAIVDAAEKANTAEARVLFLIDEVLNGTNTAERQTAARRVVRHLLELGALGVVTTHDLELATGPELAPKADLFHFRERISHDDEGRLQISFEYRLRPGLARSTNALALLEYVGLPAE